jgi:KDO2-lipid IV(A) lauroyltransferase
LTNRYAILPDWFYYFFSLPILALLPRHLGYRLSRAQGRHVYRVQKQSRIAAEANLERVFSGDSVAQDPAAIVRKSFEVRIAEDLDGYYFARFNRQNLHQYFTFEGLKHLDAARREGKGALLLSGHVGAVASGVLALGLKGYETAPLGNDSRVDTTMSAPVRAFAKWQMKWLQKKLAGRVIFVKLNEGAADHGPALVKVLEALRKNQFVVMAVDIPADRSHNVSRARFLGQDCRFPSGIVRLAQLSGAPIIPFFILREEVDWAHQRIEVQPPVELSGDRGVDFQRCIDRLDAVVRQHPGHWTVWDSLTTFEG